MNGYHKAGDIWERVRRTLSPPIRQTVSQWADRWRILSAASAEPGRWRTSRAPYLKEIMDSVSDTRVREMWWMASAQVGKSETLNNILGYFIDVNPGPVLFVQPTIDMAQSYSKDRLQPMFRDTPRLRDKVAENKSRDSDNTILHKQFHGGTLDLGGANSPAGLASRPKRIILCDEIDRYPASAGAEGDPVGLAQKRSVTYWNRFFAAFSTPTIKGLSRIEKGFLTGDQRRYHVPCPHCGERFAFEWERLDFSQRGTPEEPLYICPHCNAAIKHSAKAKMLHKGEWVAAAEFKGIRSYHINELYSPWSDWAKIVYDFLAAKKLGQHSIKVWKNTSLGLPYEEAGDSMEARVIQARSEPSSDTLQEPVLVITAGVDVQRDRLEIEVVGWGAGDESWSLDYHVIHGDVKHAAVWEELTARVVNCRYAYADGTTLGIPIIGIDAGDGNVANDVMAFCARNQRGRLGCLATKGASTFDAPIWVKPTIGKNKSPGPWMIGSSQIKLRVFDSLRLDQPGPGYMHFPDGRPDQYYRGLTSEKLVTVHNKAGWPRREWHKIYDRNEPLDCRVIAYAMLKVLNPDYEVIAAKRAEKNGEKPAETTPQPQIIAKKRPKMAIRLK
jgi:phage terminase large subunit GpA-like protein